MLDLTCLLVAPCCGDVPGHGYHPCGAQMQGVDRLAAAGRDHNLAGYTQPREW
jgi:hypothetical protein